MSQVNYQLFDPAIYIFIYFIYFLYIYLFNCLFFSIIYLLLFYYYFFNLYLFNIISIYSTQLHLFPFYYFLLYFLLFIIYFVTRLIPLKYCNIVCIVNNVVFFLFPPLFNSNFVIPPSCAFFLNKTAKKITGSMVSI
jgi:hypothetical protein